MLVQQLMQQQHPAESLSELSPASHLVLNCGMLAVWCKHDSSIQKDTFRLVQCKHRSSIHKDTFTLEFSSHPHNALLQQVANLQVLYVVQEVKVHTR